MSRLRAIGAIRATDSTRSVRVHQNFPAENRAELPKAISSAPLGRGRLPAIHRDPSPSKAAVTFFRATAGKLKNRGLSSGMRRCSSSTAALLDHTNYATYSPFGIYPVISQLLVI